MKYKVGAAITVLLGISLCFAGKLYAADLDTTAKDRSPNMAKEIGLTESGQASINETVNPMPEQYADKDEIRNTAADMTRTGKRDEELKSSVESMNEQGKNGKTPQEAGNIVSQTAHAAQAEGLKGDELAYKVHTETPEMQTEKRVQQESKYEDNGGESHVRGKSLGYERRGDDKYYGDRGGRQGQK